MNPLAGSCMPVIATLALLGCGSAPENRLPAEARVMLERATRIEILALDPVPAQMRSPPPAETWHDFGVLGRATLSDAAECAELAQLILRGIRESDGTVAACFDPRHGLRVEEQGKVLELLICYECLSMQVFEGSIAPGGKPAWLLTSSTPEPGVTRIYERAGLRIEGR